MASNLVRRWPASSGGAVAFLPHRVRHVRRGALLSTSVPCRCAFPGRRQRAAAKINGVCVAGPWLPEPVKNSQSIVPQDPPPGVHIFGKAVMEDALCAVDAEAGLAVSRQEDWPSAYSKHFEKATTLAGQSAEAAVRIAQQGLSGVERLSRFCRHREMLSVTSADELCAKYGGLELFDKEVGGHGDLDMTTEVSYRGQVHRGDSLEQLLQSFAARGVIEADCVPAVLQASGVDLSDHQVIVLGAASDVRPTEALLRHGATVVGIDERERKDLWTPLCAVALKSKGRLRVPITPSAVGALASAGFSQGRIPENLGTDVLKELAELIPYFSEVVDLSKPLTIVVTSCGVGEEMLQKAVAYDAIVQTFVAQCAAKGLRLPQVAYFAPPTAVWSSPNPAAAPANCLLTAQGPEFALSTQIMQWRAVDLLSRGGCVSFYCSPIARGPHFVQRMQALEHFATGLRYFQPAEVFTRQTASEVMSAMLVADIHKYIKSTSAEENGEQPLHSSPLQHLSQKAFHGGIWRLSYKLQSVFGPARVMGALKQFGLVPF